MKCDHEWFQGKCIHCEITPPELRELEALRTELATVRQTNLTHLGLLKECRAELAKEREAKEEAESKVCDECSPDNYGWKFNAVEGRHVCSCISESEAYQELLRQKETAEARLQHLQTICGQPNCGDFEAAMCEWKAKAEAAEAQVVALQNPRKLAKRFHDIYEALAAEFHYKTREDTKIFDPESSNGQLMIATCKVILQSLPAHAANYCISNLQRELRESEPPDA